MFLLWGLVPFGTPRHQLAFPSLPLTAWWARPEIQSGRKELFCILLWSSFPAQMVCCCACVAVEWAIASAQGRWDCSAKGIREKVRSITSVDSVNLNLIRPNMKPHSRISYLSFNVMDVLKVLTRLILNLSGILQIWFTIKKTR